MTTLLLAMIPFLLIPARLARVLGWTGKTAKY
jgi:hypothetical protein